MPSYLDFAPNLSTLFDDDDFIGRFKKVSDLGFKVVEAQSLYHLDLEDLNKARKQTGLEIVMIDSPTSGSIDHFDGKAYGLACIPGQEIEYCSSLIKATEYATTLRCNKIHLLAGFRPDGFDEDELMVIYKKNMLYTANYFEEFYHTVGLIEPICSQEKENYFMDSFQKAADIVKEIDSRYLKLSLDLYHLQMLEGDVEAGIRKYLKYAGHVQISQAPERREPFYPGIIDYDKVFYLLDALDYTGRIGLEYTSNDPEECLTWVETFL